MPSRLIGIWGWGNQTEALPARNELGAATTTPIYREQAARGEDDLVSVALQVLAEPERLVYAWARLPTCTALEALPTTIKHH